jgi:dolichol-phosphate mannosyltransferase
LDRPELSVVAATYFEEECIDEFVRQVLGVFDAEGLDAELVLVDDGSRDRTVELVRAWTERDARVALVELAYNHGKPGAVTAGLAAASGDAVVLMDPDLQDPPEEIPRLLAKLREGHDLVWGVCDERPAPFLVRLMSKLFWFVLERFTGLTFPRNLSTMRILSRPFVDRFLHYGEANRFIEGLFMHVGLRRAELLVERRERFAGTSKFGFRRRMRLATTAITSFSDIPLKVATRVGTMFVMLGLAAAVLLVVLRLGGLDFQIGWPSVICVILVGSGLNLAFLGVLGKYVGNVYREVKHRPVFAVRATANVRRDVSDVFPAARPTG